MDMTRQFNIIKEDLEDLKKSLSKQKPMELPEDSSQVEVDSDMSRPETADNNTISEYDQSIFIARRTVGLQGIYPSDIDRQFRLAGARDDSEALLFAVREYTKHEMKVPSAVFETLKIKHIFPPAREPWNILYIEFASESSVHTLYSFTRNMQSCQRLVPYIPKLLYPEYKELQSLAYSLRHSDMKYKTRVRMGKSAFVLFKRKPQEKSWVSVPVMPQKGNQEHSATQGHQDNLNDPSILSRSSPDSALLNLRPQSAFAASINSENQK